MLDAGGTTSPAPDGKPSRAGTSERHDSKYAGGYALGILFWVAVWIAMAAVVGNDIIFAGPFKTVAALGESLATPAFWGAVGTTCARITLVGTAASLLGMLLGAASCRLRWLDALLAPAMQAMKSAPVACVIVIVLVAWGSMGALVTIVAFVALPPFYIATREAHANRDVSAERVLGLAGVSQWRIYVAFVWPSTLPLLSSAAKTAVAMSWRAGITAEILCLPPYSIGASVYSSKLMLDSAELMAWTIVVMILSWVMERLVLWLLRLSGNLSALATLDASWGKAERSMGSRANDCSETPLPAAIELQEASKTFGGELVVRHIALTVAPGQRTCLMAPTGSGKSTVIRMLVELLQPDSGTIRRPARLGLMMQEPCLAEELTAYQNIAIAASGDVDKHDIDGLIACLLPPGSSGKAAKDLSGGTRRLVELIRTVVSPTSALVLDEPFAGLDDESRRRACEFIIANLNGRPLLLATHNAEDAKLLDARIYRL